MPDTGKNPFVMAITSGKGGVGKSVLAANLGRCLAESGVKTLVWDADRFFPNQHFIFGCEPPVRLNDVYSGKVTANRAIFKIEENLSLLAETPPNEYIRQDAELSLLDIYRHVTMLTDFDVILLDTPAGLSEQVLDCCQIADAISLVVTDEPTSLLDAYGLVKILLQFTERENLNIIVNNVIDFEDASDISTKLNLATKRFLKVELEGLGFVPYNRVVRQSILLQELFVKTDPDSDVSRALRRLSAKVSEKYLITA
ncbi:MAG: MinD/ParA family ATP-binding protein [Chloroflexota bacterium]